MDPEPRLIRPAPAALVAAALVAGCAGSRAGLPADARVLARGSLAYAVAIADDAVVTVELEERFALVVRNPDGRERRRVDLGPAERDLPGLAVGGGQAWVGGDDQQVRAIDLASGQVTATWPVGADVTALAWHPAGWVAIGDATGVVCLRRVRDAALVHCLAGADAVTGITAAGDRLWVSARARSQGLTVPALAPIEGAAPPLRWRGQPITVDGRTVRAGGRPVLELSERVRSVAVGSHGELVIAAWVTRLDDPAVVVLPGR